jgi:hypothetical protein
MCMELTSTRFCMCAQQEQISAEKFDSFLCTKCTFLFTEGENVDLLIRWNIAFYRRNSYKFAWSTMPACLPACLTACLPAAKYPSLYACPKD